MIAAGQVVLAAVLDGVTIAHLSPAVSSFGASAPAGDLAKADAQTSLLYICGSLPLFLGGEVAGPGLAEAVGIGIAVSIAGVILCEYLALTRLARAITPWRLRPITGAIGALLVLAAPFSLIDPQGFYSMLIKPSLIALWLSQLIVFAVYPRFTKKHRMRALPAWTLSLIASGLAAYGLWTAFQSAAS